MIKLLIILTVTCVMLLALLTTAIALSPREDDTSYPAYYYSLSEQAQSTVPACTLTLLENDVYHCQENGKLPTADQSVLWQGYVLWHSCYSSGDKYACQALDN